ALPSPIRRCSSRHRPSRPSRAPRRLPGGCMLFPERPESRSTQSRARSRPIMLTRRTAILVTGAGLAGAGLAAACSQSPPEAPRAPATSACWTSRPPLPFAVQEIYPAAHKGRIHIAGGLLSADGVRVTGVSGRHIAYDPATGASADLAALPSLRHHPHAVSHGGRLYVLGGFGTNPGAVNWIMSADTLVYAEAGNAWSSLAAAPAPHAEVVATSLGDRIHLVGGRMPRGDANLAYGDHA